MGRSRRAAIDQNTGAITIFYEADSSTVSFGPGYNDYVEVPSSRIWTSLTDSTDTFVVWGQGFVSVGPVTAEQISYMENATAGGAIADLSAFPGSFINSGIGYTSFFTIDQYNTVAFDFDYTVYFDEYGYHSQGSSSPSIKIGDVISNDSSVNYWSVFTSSGTDAKDVVSLNDAPQSYYGLGGNDVIYAGGGVSLVDGGDGDDRLSAGSNYASLVGGAGNDTIYLAAGNSGYGGLGNDRFILLANSSVSIRADGGDGDDVFDVRPGSSFSNIDGGTGNDTAIFDFTQDGKLVFDVNNDAHYTPLRYISYTSIENYRVSAGAFDDVIVTGAGSDFIDGGAGDDRIFGSGGNDRLAGGTGNDAEFGDDGADQFSAGTDAGDDILFGGAGLDLASYLGAAADMRINLSTGRALSATADDASNTGVDILLDIENVTGGSFNDLIVGNEFANRLLGGDGTDFLYGGRGKDRLDGGEGDDKLFGQIGADTLSGGAGDDQFVYEATSDSSGKSLDTILDFEEAGAIGGDKINLFAIDATPGGADDPFAFGRNKPTAHGVWFATDTVAQVTHILADTDGDPTTAELDIKVSGVLSFVAGDFVL